MAFCSLTANGLRSTCFSLFLSLALLVFWVSFMTLSDYETLGLMFFFFFFPSLFIVLLFFFPGCGHVPKCHCLGREGGWVVFHMGVLSSRCFNHLK